MATVLSLRSRLLATAFVLATGVMVSPIASATSHGGAASFAGYGLDLWDEDLPEEEATPIDPVQW